MGLTVVAGRDSGAVPWVLGPGLDDGPAPGLLVDVRSAEALTEGLVAAFDADYGVRSAAGVARVQAHFAPGSVAAAYERRYESLMRGTTEAQL